MTNFSDFSFCPPAICGFSSPLGPGGDNRKSRHLSFKKSDRCCFLLPPFSSRIFPCFPRRPFASGDRCNFPPPPSDGGDKHRVGTERTEAKKWSDIFGAISEAAAGSAAAAAFAATKLAPATRSLAVVCAMDNPLLPLSFAAERDIIFGRSQISI